MARSKKGRNAPAPATHRTREESPFWAFTFVPDRGAKRKTISTKTRNHAQAVKVRNKIITQIWGGRLAWLEASHTLNDLLELVVAHYQTKGNRSLRALVLRLKNIRKFPEFRDGEVPARKVTEAMIEAFKGWRRGWPKGNAKGYINRELAILRQAFRKGSKRLDENGSAMVDRVPGIEFFDEAKPRRRFAEEYEVSAVIAGLRAVAAREPRRRGHADVADLVEFLSLTGWRVGEPPTLRWSLVNWFTKTLLLEDSKTGESDEFPFGALPEMEELLERRRRITEEVERRPRAKRCPWIFHRNGQPIRTIQKAWRDGCREAGIPTSGPRALRPHDFRRTQARNVMQATGDPILALDLVRWKSLSMLKRYRILDERDRSEGLAKVRELRERKRAEQSAAVEDMTRKQREG
jgi:integrase